MCVNAGKYFTLNYSRKEILYGFTMFQTFLQAKRTFRTCFLYTINISIHPFKCIKNYCCFFFPLSPKSNTGFASRYFLVGVKRRRVNVCLRRVHPELDCCSSAFWAEGGAAGHLLHRVTLYWVTISNRACCFNGSFTQLWWQGTLSDHFASSCALSIVSLGMAKTAGLYVCRSTSCTLWFDGCKTCKLLCISSAMSGTLPIVINVFHGFAVRGVCFLIPQEDININLDSCDIKNTEKRGFSSLSEEAIKVLWSKLN